MELISQRDVVDKDLVDQYGAVAYDYESLPKVVAVHTCTWTGNMSALSKKEREATSLALLEQFPRNGSFSMRIGIRSIGSAKHKDILKRCISSGDHSCYVNSAKRGLDCVDHELKNGNYCKISETAEPEMLKADDKCSPCDGVKSLGNSISTNRNREKFANSSVVEVTIGNKPQNYPSINSKSELCREVNTPVSARETEDYQAQSIQRSVELPQDRTPDLVFLNLSDEHSACDTQSPNALELRPRKRPRKSTPRKLDQEWQNACLSGNIDKSDTIVSADVAPSVEPVPKDTTMPLQSSIEGLHESFPDTESCAGTKVRFQRIAGVWSVSLLNKPSAQTNNQLQGMLNLTTSKPSQSSDNTDVLSKWDGASLNREDISVSCDPLTSLLPPWHDLYSSIDKSCNSVRDARIKELLARQEKLLKEMREKKNGN